MDSHDRRSRQTGSTGASLLQHNAQSTGQYPAVTGPGDRYQVRGGTGHLATAPSAGRSNNMPAYTYQTNAAGGYGDIAAGQTMQSTAVPYPTGGGTEYGMSSDTTQRSQQQSSQHQSAHTSQQAHHQSPQQQQQHHPSPQQYHNLYQQPSPPSQYEGVSQYPPRQSAAIEVLSNQFAGVPQAYYVAGEGGPTSAPNSGIPSQGVQQYNQMSYNSTQSPVARDALHPTYGAGITDTSQVATNAQQNYGQQVGYAAAATAQAADLDNTFAQYEDALRRTFEGIRDSNLHEAGETIIGLSEWLLVNAESLGLVRDDETAHATRLKLWSEFNTCWISMLQRQKDLTTEMLETGQRPRSLLGYEQMETMGNELARLCDNMEKHGLVDYQMGVWEEDIITLLIQCLNMLDEQPDGVAAQFASRRR